MKHMLVPASYLILEQDNKILLLKRANTGYEDGKYGLISGGVKERETFTQTIIRKAYEEAGIILTSDDVELVHMVHRKGANAERIDAFFRTKHWKGVIENREPQKCTEVSWFPLDNLPSDIVPKIHLALQDINDGIIYSEHGWL